MTRHQFGNISEIPGRQKNGQIRHSLINPHNWSRVCYWISRQPSCCVPPHLGRRGSCRAVVLAFFHHGRTRKNGTVDGVASRVERMWLVPFSAIERSSRMMVVPLGGRGSCRAVVLAFFHHGMPRKYTEKGHRGWCCIARGNKCGLSRFLPLNVRTE